MSEEQEIDPTQVESEREPDLSNDNRSKELGCADAMGEARDCGADNGTVSIAMDVLTQDGLDSCVEFLSEQTNGRYPPRAGLLPRCVPEELLVQGGSVVKPRRVVWWDCLDWSGLPPQPGNILFGNANIGSLNLTNMQVAGTLTPDDAVYVGGWSVTTNAENIEVDTMVKNQLSDAVVTLRIEDRPIASRHAADLYKEAHPIEEIVPVRQGIRVDFDFHHRGFRGFCTAFENRFYQQNGPLRIWVNLEGWVLRRTRPRQ